MTKLKDITLYDFSRTSQELDSLLNTNPEFFYQFVSKICKDFPLAGELMQAILTFNQRANNPEILRQLDQRLRSMLCTWIIVNDLDVPNEKD